MSLCYQEYQYAYQDSYALIYNFSFYDSDQTNRLLKDDMSNAQEESPHGTRKSRKSKI